MRKCKDGFLQTYLDYTSKQESPELFHLWASISIVGQSLGRKCFISRGYYNTYPNQYIVLVSESARCRKTTSADIAIGLYREAEIGQVIMEKITTRSLSRFMHEVNEKTAVSAAYIYSPELGTFLAADSYTNGLMMLITTLYGCPADWEYRTHTQGTDILKNVFLSILGCTTPSWLAGMPPDMVEGGLSSRTIFVVQNIPREPNPRPFITAEMRELRGCLIEDLKEIATLEGEFKLTEKAEIYYDSWYIREYKGMDDKDVRLKAYYGRKGDHVLKLAMIISAARSSAMVIDHHDINASLSFLKQVETHMPTAFRGVSFSASTKHMDRIHNQIEEAGGKISHSALLRKNHFYLDKDELRKVIETLIESNIIRMELLKGGNKMYHLI